MGAMKVWDGSAWQTVAPFSERASCFVGPDAPVGAAYAGDLWWDTDDPTIAYPGAELAYNQITAGVSVTATSAASGNLIIEGTTRSYDGSPVIVEINGIGTNPSVANGYLAINLFDGATDLGYLTMVMGQGQTNASLFARRRLTPTVGTHNYRAIGWIAGAGTGSVAAGAGGPGAWTPAFIRVTRV